MNRNYLVPCFVSLFLVPVAGVSIGSASEIASPSRAAASNANGSDAENIAPPAGFSADWLNRSPSDIRESEGPSPSVAQPRRPRVGWKAEGDREDAHFGTSVGSAGDVNGDGYNDIIVGAPSCSPYRAGNCRAYAYHGSASGPSLMPDWMVESEDRFDEFGESVATAGDVNGDGYADVIVGAPYYTNGPDEQVFEGGVFLYYGSASGLSLEPNWTAESNQGGGFSAAPFFGWSAGTAGDVNGDGYDDVIVGAPAYDHEESREGAAFLYYGSPSGLSTTPGWAAEGNQSGSFFGGSVGTAGDVNGDGYDDVIVGAPAYDTGQGEGLGRAFVYLGSASGLSRTPDWTADSDQDLSFASSAGTAGDVNGDGYADVIVGTNLYPDDGVLYPIAFVYHGSASGLSLTPNWTGESNEDDAEAARHAVGTAGDVDADDYGDVIVGVRYVSEVFVYKGSTSGLSVVPNWTIKAHSFLGYSVGTAGDVNGDGHDEIIAGAPEYENGQVDEGAAVIFRTHPR